MFCQGASDPPRPARLAGLVAPSGHLQNRAHSRVLARFWLSGRPWNFSAELQVHPGLQVASKWPPSSLQMSFRSLLDTSKSCPVLRSGSIFAFWAPLESFCGVARALPGLLHDKLNRQRLPILPVLHSFCTAWLLNFMSMDIDRGKLVFLIVLTYLLIFICMFIYLFSCTVVQLLVF